MPIHRLLYRSDMALAGSAADVQQQVAEIVEQSAARNASNGLSGALLLSRDIFIQALEGPLPALETTFERICCDLRHRRLTLLEFLQAEDRVFGAWSMTRITTDGTIERLFSVSDLFAEQLVDRVPAQTIIQLMQSVLMAGSHPPLRTVSGGVIHSPHSA